MKKFLTLFSLFLFLVPAYFAGAEDLKITALSPKKALIGDKINIIGENFDKFFIKEIIFGDTKVKEGEYKIIDAGNIEVTVPFGTVGGRVTIKAEKPFDEAGGSVLGLGTNYLSPHMFYVAYPKITSVSPATGEVGSVVSIRGEYIKSNTRDTQVFFGENKAEITINKIQGSEYEYEIKAKVPTVKNTSSTEGAKDKETTEEVIISLKVGEVLANSSQKFIVKIKAVLEEEKAKESDDSSKLSESAKKVALSGGTKEVKFKGLVPVCNTEKDDNGEFKDPCDFNMVIAMINHALEYFTKYLVTPLFAILIVYSGILYISSVSSPKNKEKAKTILTNSLLGYLLVLASWLIINTILKALEFSGPNYLG